MMQFSKPTTLINQAKAGLGFRRLTKIPRDIIIEAGYGDYLPTVSDTVLAGYP